MKKPQKKPEKKPESTSDLAKQCAARLVAEVRCDRCGRELWKRLSFEGRRVECRAALCDEIMKDLTPDSVAGWWRFVAVEIDAIIAAE